MVGTSQARLPVEWPPLLCSCWQSVAQLRARWCGDDDDDVYDYESDDSDYEDDGDDGLGNSTGFVISRFFSIRLNPIRCK